MDQSQNSPWVVMKFGGTSVATPEKWHAIKEIVSQADGPVFLVCSALSGVSNLLEELINAALKSEHEATLKKIKEKHVALCDGLGLSFDQVLKKPWEDLCQMAQGLSLLKDASPLTRAKIMAQGELLSTPVGAAFLGACFLDARQYLQTTEPHMQTDVQRFLSAICEFDSDSALQKEIQNEKIVVTQGFIAKNLQGETAVLGRGGSDTSAAYFAAKLQAKRLEIWTDVPGLFTTNPKQISEARLLKSLNYDEAMELATLGAKVLHPRSIGPARAFNIPVHVKWTENSKIEGTVIESDCKIQSGVKAVLSNRGVNLISVESLRMWHQVGFLSRVFDCFKDQGISIDLVATSNTNVTVSLDTDQVIDELAIEKVIKDLNQFSKARRISGGAKVSLVGRNIRSLLHQLGGIFSFFEKQNVYLLCQAASDLNLTFVVDEAQADRLVDNIHQSLFSINPDEETFGQRWKELSNDVPEAPKHRPSEWWVEEAAKLGKFRKRGKHLVFFIQRKKLKESMQKLRSISGVSKFHYAMKANFNEEILRYFESEGMQFENGIRWRNRTSLFAFSKTRFRSHTLYS